MKKKGIISWVFVIVVVWIFIVVLYNSGYQQSNRLVNSTLGKIIHKENILLQRLCKPFNVSASIKSGNYADTQVVNLKTSLPVSAIYYSLDGTEPTVEGKYHTSLKVYGTETLTFVAVNLLTGAKTNIVSETYLLPCMIERMIIDHENHNHILIREIKNEISKLDSIVLKRLFTQGIRIKFVNSFDDEPSLRGYSIPKEALALYYAQTVYVLMNANQFNGMVSTYIHELGHAYDYNFRIDGEKLSDQSEFMESWQAESLALLPNMHYYNSSRVETFAQCFALYYYSGTTNKLLKSKAPQIYNYLEKVTK